MMAEAYSCQDMFRELTSIACENPQDAPLGVVPEGREGRLGPEEVALHRFCHDALHGHHNNDIRCLAVLRLSIMDEVELHVWIVGSGEEVRNMISMDDHLSLKNQAQNR